MPAIPGTTKISLPLAPNDSVDTYPITNPTYGLGGLRTVANVTDRDAIVQPRREQGMVVYVQDIQKFYTLVGSTGNTAWTEVISNGASAASVVSSFNGLTGAVSYSPQLATSTLTGVASFGNQFVVSAAGAVGLTTNYVISVDGRTGNVGLPVASTSVTGVAYFKETHFNVGSDGYVELETAYTVTGDTVVQGSGISVSRNGNAVTISSSAVVTVSIATNSITGVAAFTGNDFSVSPLGVVSLTGGLVRSFNGLTGAIVYTPPLASSTATGSASFNSTHFAIGNTGHVSLASAYQVTGDTVSQGSGIIVSRSGNNVTITSNPRLATTSLTGEASFNATHFNVGSTGHVSLNTPYTVTGDTVVAGTNVGVVRSGNSVTLSSTHPLASASATGVASFGNEFVVSAAGAVSLTANYVRSFNGATGTVVYAPPMASSTATGSASFNVTHFNVGSTGHVSLAPAYQVTGDTVSQGTGIIVSRSGNSVTITSNPRLATSSLTGEASFNATHFNVGSTGHVSLNTPYTVTGDTVVAGTNVGVSRSGNTVTVSSTHPIASASATGVASFNSSFFTVSSGAVSLASVYQVTGDTVSQGSGIIVSRSGNNVTITSNPRLATTSLTGEASFNDTHFAIGNTGHVSLASAYRVTGDTVVAGTNVGVSRSGNTVTVSSTHPIATSSVTGVASFNSSFFTVSSGAVSLASAYQVTGDTVSQGTGIIVSRSGNSVTVTSNPRLATTSLTGEASFNDTHFAIGNTGHVSLAPAYRVTGDTVVAGTNVGVARSGNTVTVSSTHPIATSSITGVASFGNQFVVSAAGAVSLTANIVTAVNGRTGNVGLPLATTTGITGVAWFNPTDFNVGSTGRVALTTKAFQAVLPGLDDSPAYLYMPSALQSNKIRLTSDESYGATSVSEILATQIVTTSTTTRLLLAGAVSGEIIFNTSGSSAQSMTLPTYYPVADVTVVAMTDFDASPVSYCTSKFMIVKNETGGTEFTEYANICSGTQLGTYAIQATGPESYWGLVVTPTSANKTFFSVNATRFKRPYSSLV